MGLALCELRAKWPKRGPWKAGQESEVLGIVARARDERSLQPSCAHSLLCDIRKVT